jgi:phosphoglycerate dehydrogenase-like enzyme
MLIFTDLPLSSEHEARIRSLSPKLQVAHGTGATSSERTESLKAAEVIYTCDADFLPSEVPCLRWLQVNTAAVDRVLGKPIATAKIPIANVSGAYSVAVAECAIGMLLALTRRISLSAQWQGRQEWPEDLSPFCGEDLHGRTMGIVGYGSIGRQIAKLAQAMGVTVLACKRNPHQRADATYRIPGTGDPDGQIPEAWFGTDQLALMLGRCDFAMVTLPLTPATHGLVGKNELKALPPHAYVLNVGRGPLIDEAALVAALEAGKLAGAALDVFTVEPLPAESPLWKMPNVLVTPHIASWTKNQSDRATEVLIENLSRDLNGQPLVNVIDRSAMY